MKNIFLSHYYKDDEKVQQIKQRLIERGYEARNFSVDSTKHKDGRTPSDKVIERYLRIRIQLSSTFICVIGPETHTRRWVDFEIQEAIKQGKPIVGFYTHGSKDKVLLPDSFKKYSNSIVGWNSIEKLGEIIEGNDAVFDYPDRENKYFSIKRITC